MDRPLWQILLPMFVLAFVAQRAALAFVGWEAGPGVALAAGHALEAAIGLTVAAGLWWGRRWVVGAILALGVSVAATALLGAFSLGALPALPAISRVLVAALAAGGLALFMRHELGESGTARTPGRGDTAEASPGAR